MWQISTGRVTTLKEEFLWFLIHVWRRVASAVWLLGLRFWLCPFLAVGLCISHLIISLRTHLWNGADDKISAIGWLGERKPLGRCLLLSKFLLNRNSLYYGFKTLPRRAVLDYDVNSNVCQDSSTELSLCLVFWNLYLTSCELLSHVLSIVYWGEGVLNVFHVV